MPRRVPTVGTYAHRLWVLMGERGLDARALAAEADLDEGAIGAILREVTKRPRRGTCEKIAKALRAGGDSTLTAAVAELEERQRAYGTPGHPPSSEEIRVDVGLDEWVFDVLAAVSAVRQQRIDEVLANIVAVAAKEEFAVPAIADAVRSIQAARDLSSKRPA